MATFRELLTEAKQQIRETDPEGAEALLADGATLLDVREPDEYEQGAVPGSIHIPRGNLESNIENRVTERTTPLVVMCAGGVRSAFAAQTLAAAGLHRRRVHGRGLQPLEGRRARLEATPHPGSRAAQSVPAPPPAARGGRGGAAEAARRQGPDARRRWAGLSGGALPGRRRRGHHRHRRHGRGRRVQPAAPDPAQPRPGRAIARSIRPRRRSPCSTPTSTSSPTTSASGPTTS